MMKVLSQFLKVNLLNGRTQQRLLSLFMAFVLSLPQAGFGADEANGKRLSLTELTALTQKDEADFAVRNANVADTFHLLQQSIEIYDKGGTLVLDSPFYEISDGLPIIKGGLDHFAIHPSRDEFAYEKVLDGVVRYRHVFHGLKIVKIFETAELILLLDKNGQVHIMPTFFKKSYLFAVGVPIFKNVVNLNSMIQSYSNLDPQYLRLSQWSRGVIQNLDFEKARADKISAPEYFHKQGKIAARDLIVYSPQGTVYAIESADRILESLLQRTKYFDLLLLNLGVQTQAQAFVNEELQDQQAEEIAKNSNLNELVLAATPRSIFKDIEVRLNSWKASYQKNKSDLATIDELQSFIPKINQSIEDFKRKLQIDGKQAGFKGYNAREEFNALTHGQAHGDIGALWIDVVKFSQSNATAVEAQTFAAKATAALKSSMGTLKKAGKALAWVAVPGAAVYGGYQAEAKWAVNLIDYAYNSGASHFVNHVLPDSLVNPATRLPMLLSSASLMGMIGVVFLISYLSPEVLYQTGQAMKMLNKKSTRADQMMNSAREIKKMELFKRVVLFGYRFWGTFSLSAHNYIGRATGNDNFLIAAEKGLNPFKRNEYKSFVDTSDETVKYAQMKGIHAEVIRRRVAKSQATVLAIMVASQKYGIDPATLATALEKGPKFLNAEIGDKSAGKEIQLTIQSMSKKLHASLAASQEPNFKLSVDEFVEAYEATKSVAESISNQGSLKTRMQYFNWYTRDRAKALAKVLARLGQEEYETLMNDIPSNYIVNQIWKEFWTDHFIVSVYPQAYGAMANPSDPILPDSGNRLTMDPNGSWQNLWTNPIHMVRVVNNTVIHFFVAGAGLAMQRARQVAIFDPRFGPLENVENPAAVRVDRFKSGVSNWTKALVDTRENDMGTKMKMWFIKKYLTIQADFVVMVGSKMLLQGQAFSMAFKGWLVLLTTGVIAIKQYWMYLQAGNEYYGIAMSKNRERLNGLIVQLGQSSRLNDLEKMRATLLEISSIYKSDAPEIWNTWTSNGGPAAGFEDLLKSNNNKRLKEVVDEAMKLLGTQAPFPTEANDSLMNNSVWAVAFLTTYLFTEMHVNSSNSHYLTPFNLMKDFAMNAGFVYLFYKAFASDGWWSKVLNRIDDYKARRLAKKNGQLPDVEDQASQENKKPGFCQVVLKKITFRK